MEKRIDTSGLKDKIGLDPTQRVSAMRLRARAVTPNGLGSGFAELSAAAGFANAELSNLPDGDVDQATALAAEVIIFGE